MLTRRHIRAVAGVLFLSVLVQCAAKGSPATSPAPATGPATQPQDGPPAIDRLPNIVLIAIDTLRSDHLGCYGYKAAATPNIDRLASEGVLFEQCSSPASWTMPAFMSILTGVHAQAHGCTNGNYRLPRTLPTLAEKLKQKGYFCGAIVSNPLMNAKYGFGRGFDRYDDYSVFLDAELNLLSAQGKPRPSASVEELVTSPLVTQEALSLLKAARKAGKPYFLLIHYFDPHDSYVPPATYKEKFCPEYNGSVNGTAPRTMLHTPPRGDDLAHLIGLYNAEIAHNDFQLGKLLEAVDAMPQPEQTLTIFLSDHGEAFGEHGMLSHGYNVYREVLAVPMIWRWPGVLPKGHRVTSPVSTLDLPVTVRDLLRLEGVEHMQGGSLWPALGGKAVVPDRVLFSEQANHGPSHGPSDFETRAVLMRGDMRLHCHFTNSPEQAAAKWELYNLSKDPSEQRSLAGVKAPELAEMQQMMMQVWLQSSRLGKSFRPAGVAERVDLDQREKDRIKGLGYTEDAPPRPAAAPGAPR